jgi:hypothetical protein
MIGFIATHAQIGVFQKVISDSVFSKDYRFRSLPNYSLYNGITNIISPTTGTYDLTTPPGNTATRPTVPSGKYILRYNTDSSALEIGNPSQVWRTLAQSSVSTFDTSSISNFGLKVRSLLSASAPLLYNGVTGNLSIPVATSTVSGYLSQADWVIFNAKLPDPGSNGLVARTALGTTAARQLIAASTNISLVNANGVSGNPSIDINDTLFLRQLQLPYIPAALGSADSALFLNRSTNLLEVRAVNPAGTGTFNKAGGGISYSGDSLYLNQAFTRNLFSAASPITYNSSTGVFGADTAILVTQYDLTLISTATLNNIGSGFRAAATPSGNIKTFFGNNTIVIDSSSNSNALTFKVDTSQIATQFDLTLVNNGVSRRGDTTQLGAINTSGSPLNHDTWINTAGFTLTAQGSFATGDVFIANNTGAGSGLRGSAIDSYGVSGTSNNLYGVYGTSTISHAIQGWTTNGNTAGYLENTASSTNTVTPTLQVKRTTSGTAAAGIGSSIEYYVEKDNGANNTPSHTLRSILTSPVNGAEVGQFEIYGVNNAVLARKMAITGAGQQIWDGYPALTAQNDTATYKPVAIDGSGNVVKMIGWAGGGGGSASLTATQVGFGGPSNTLTGEAELNYITATNTLTADTMRQIINRNDTLYSRYKVIVNPTGESYAQVDGAQELGPGLFIRQQITNDGRDVNEHGVIDRTEFARAGKAYASFDAQPVITGVNFDHYSAFQARPDINITGTMSNAYILYSRPLLTGSGTITNLYHSGVPIDYTNNGTITNEYGSYIRTLKGVNRWAYYAVADKSFFGGNVGIGTDGPTYPLTLNKNGVSLIGSWVNVAQISNAAGTAGIDLGYDNSTNDGIITSQGASSGFQFWTHNGSSFGLRGVFASSGNFGLGTGSPGRLLTLNNSIIPTFGFSRSGVEKALIGVSDATDHGVTGSAANDWFLRIVSGQKMLFSTDEGATANLVINASGNTLINTASDNSTGAKLQVNGAITTVTDSAGSPINMAWIDSNGKIRKAAAPGGSATTIYNGDGTLAGARLVSTGGNTLTVSGANNSDTVMAINNTGTTGLGLHVSGTALGINIVSSAGSALQAFGSTRGAIITGDTDEGLLVKSNAVRGARIQTVPSSTNTVVEVLQLERGSSGGPGATGIGEYISFLNKTSTNSSDVSNTIVSKFTDGTTATRTSQFVITGVNSASATNILTLDGDGSMTTIGRRFMKVTTSSAGTLTLGNSESYVFTGSSGTAWTLPAVSGTTGLVYYIKNRGSAAITLGTAAAANELYTSSAVNTYTVNAGEAIILISDGTYFNLQ